MEEDTAAAAVKLRPAPTLAEVREWVESAAPTVRLQFDDESSLGHPPGGGKGRYLVARCALKVGEILFSEVPIFTGSSTGAQSRRAYRQSFLDLIDLDDPDPEPLEFEEDCVHPRCPTVDCIAGILLAKQQATIESNEDLRSSAFRRLQQLAALHRAKVTEQIPRSGIEELLDAVLPELRALTSAEEMEDFVLAMRSNRFGGSHPELDLMFAGSMFEHSCVPNCFVGTWQVSGDGPRVYRVLRDVAEGEALSLDYLLMPEAYQPLPGRAKHLQRWGFTCTCPRCTILPDLTTAFNCLSCHMPELCPTGPGLDAAFICRACGAAPEVGYIAECRAAEKAIGDEAPTASAKGLSRFHFRHFQARWDQLSDCLATMDLHKVRETIEALVEALTRLYNDSRHPHLLDLYHVLAAMEHGHLEAQRRYLELESAVLHRFYPEEASRQDAEIMALVQGRGPGGPIHESHVESALDSMD